MHCFQTVWLFTSSVSKTLPSILSQDSIFQSRNFEHTTITLACLLVCFVFIVRCEKSPKIRCSSLPFVKGFVCVCERSSVGFIFVLLPNPLANATENGRKVRETERWRDHLHHLAGHVDERPGINARKVSFFFFPSSQCVSEMKTTHQGCF